VSAKSGPDREGLYEDDDSTAETLRIEQRLRDLGYAVLPEVLGLGGDFDFPSTSVDEIVTEANLYLRHQQTIDLAGARILAILGEVAVKAQAFDAIAAVVRRHHNGRTPKDG
jgi:hypothetical protein